MNPSLTDSPTLSRRGVLKIGLCASAFLATAGLGASLSGCSSSTPASGFAMLRASDLPFLRAVIPVLLEGAASAEAVVAGIDSTLKKLDYSLQHLSPEMFKLTQQLFDVLGMAYHPRAVDRHLGQLGKRQRGANPPLPPPLGKQLPEPAAHGPGLAAASW